MTFSIASLSPFAVNNDEEAPIFEISDYFIVGDFFKVSPQLTDAVKARKG